MLITLNKLYSSQFFYIDPVCNYYIETIGKNLHLKFWPCLQCGRHRKNMRIIYSSVLLSKEDKQSIN